MKGGTLYLILVILSSSDTTPAADFTVSETYAHTLHRNGSVSVTCHHDNMKAKRMDAKLKSGEVTVCEQEWKNCSVVWAGRNATFTLWNLKAGDEHKLYNCELSQINPFPVLTRKGVPTKLFPGSKIPFPPPRDTDCALAPTPAPTSYLPRENTDYQLFMDPLLWVLAAVAACFCLYSFIITILFLKLKVSRKEALYDTLRYVPVQQHQGQSHMQVWSVRGPREVNEEYMDMREVQPKAWPRRDLNHNSQVTHNDFTI